MTALPPTPCPCPAMNMPAMQSVPSMTACLAARCAVPHSATSPPLDLAALLPAQPGLLCSAKGDPELCFREGLLLSFAKRFVHVLLQYVHGHAAIAELCLQDLRHQRIDFLGALALCCSDTNDELLHVDQPGLWINGSGICGRLQQTDGLVDISCGDILSQLHLGNRF